MLCQDVMSTHTEKAVTQHEMLRCSVMVHTDNVPLGNSEIIAQSCSHLTDSIFCSELLTKLSKSFLFQTKCLCKENDGWCIWPAYKHSVKHATKRSKFLALGTQRQAGSGQERYLQVWLYTQDTVSCEVHMSLCKIWGHLLLSSWADKRGSRITDAALSC